MKLYIFEEEPCGRHISQVRANNHKEAISIADNPFIDSNTSYYSLNINTKMFTRDFTSA